MSFLSFCLPFFLFLSGAAGLTIPLYFLKIYFHLTNPPPPIHYHINNPLPPIHHHQSTTTNPPPPCQLPLALHPHPLFFGRTALLMLHILLKCKARHGAGADLGASL